MHKIIAKKRKIPNDSLLMFAFYGAFSWHLWRLHLGLKRDRDMKWMQAFTLHSVTGTGNLRLTCALTSSVPTNSKGPDRLYPHVSRVCISEATFLSSRDTLTSPPGCSRGGNCCTKSEERSGSPAAIPWSLCFTWLLPKETKKINVLFSQYRYVQ